MGIRFEEVKKDFLKHGDEVTILPVRGDNGSAGYDFYAKEDYVIKGNRVLSVVDITKNPNSSGMSVVFDQHLFWSDVKIKLPEDKVLLIDIRSGMGTKNGLMIANTLAVIDASYYGNESNDGNIGICIKNLSTEDYIIKKGDRIAQGVIIDYHITEDDKPLKDSRTGGFGSNGR